MDRLRRLWQVYPSVFTEGKCDSIVQSFLENGLTEGGTFNNRSDWRKSRVAFSQDKELREHLWTFAQEANANHFNLDVQNYSQLQFTEYKAEYGGKYDVHHDVNYTVDRAFDRKLSVVLQLSDSSSYEGGDFGFEIVETPDQDILRRKGTVLIFPSYLTHYVTPVTKGTRYSLVTWFEGPKWR